MPPETRQPPRPLRPLADECGAEAAQGATDPERRAPSLLSAQESARRLGVSVSSFYDWLSQSDRGEFAIRGEPVTIDYLQTGRKGQGRILLESEEVQRIKDLFRVRPRKAPVRRQPVQAHSFPGITVKLGRPK
jgi:hypothetical protein